MCFSHKERRFLVRGCDRIQCFWNMTDSKKGGRPFPYTTTFDIKMRSSPHLCRALSFILKKDMKRMNCFIYYHVCESLEQLLEQNRFPRLPLFFSSFVSFLGQGQRKVSRCSESSHHYANRRKTRLLEWFHMRT